jgi:hypothetical protein
MRYKIGRRKSLKQTLRYHELKVERGQAKCLYAGNMLKEAQELSPQEKYFYLDRMQELNDRAVRKTLHIFLNWNRGDNLDDDKMRKISQEYVQEMDLGRQPYLIYRHSDAAQPHVHIVASNIRPDGSDIVFWRPELLRSRDICRQQELKYGLQMSARRMSDEEWARQYPAQKLIYGVTPMVSTMNAVLRHVLSNYKYTSLEEFNSILKGYNMRAIQGAPDSVTRKHDGLLYIPLRDSGERIGAYVKASALRGKPTLRHLQSLFSQNMDHNSKYKQRLTAAIDWIFHNQQVTGTTFRQALLKEKIRIVEGPEEKRGFFYIDELTKTVFEGERLGRKYSAEGIGERCISEELRQRQQTLKQEQKQTLRQRPKIDLY